MDIWTIQGAAALDFRGNCGYGMHLDYLIVVVKEFVVGVAVWLEEIWEHLDLVDMASDSIGDGPAFVICCH